MNIPTVKTIMTRLNWLDKVGDPWTLAKQIRAELQDLRVRSGYWHPKEIDVLNTLDTLNTLLQTHGVESIISRQNNRISYLNTGYTYTTTICYRHTSGTIQLTSWGDIVEANPSSYE
jgi:hypothetical protein